jgi:TonB family protein
MDESLPDFSSQFLSDLQGLLEKAGRFTGATSAAMAFVEGEELVTKVSMGECAPDPGSRSPISGSFTGLCVQQHDVQRCDDASKDERVDSAACQALGISSMVIVPISEKRRVLGVLAAFSPKPNAFSPTHVALLRTIADIVIELRKRYPADPHPAGFGATRSDEPIKAAPQVDSPLVHSAPDIAAAEIEPTLVKAPETRAAVTTVLPTFASALPEKKLEPAASSSVEKSDVAMNPAAELHATMAAIPVPEQNKQEKVEPLKVEVPKQEEIRITEAKPAAEKKPVLGPVLVKPEAKPKVEHSVELWKREPLVINNAEEADEYARVVPDEPKKESEVVSTAADIGFTPVTNDAEANAHQPMFGYGYSAKSTRTGGRSISILKVIVAVLGLAAFAAAATWFFKYHSPVEQPHAVQAAAPGVQPAAPEAQTLAPRVTPDAADAQASTGPEVAMVLKKTDLKLPGGKHDAKIPDSEIVPDQTIILNGGTVPKRIGAEEAVAPPKVAADGTPGMSNILNMVKPTTQPKADFQASTISAPVLIKQVAPRFPAFARQMHIQSDRVILNGTVGKDGSVTSIKVIRGNQVFVGPAIAAVKEWKYKPAILNGQPTPSTVEIVVNFVDR